MIAVKIKLNGGIMPKKQHEGDAAFDLYVPEDTQVLSGRQIISLKFAIEIPHGYAATIQPRSGYSSKGIEAIITDDCPLDGAITREGRIDADVLRGLIDANYRGNVGVIINVHEYHDKMIIKKGTRIAQMQIVPVPEVTLEEADELSDTDRGEGGFGSTNK